MINVTVVVLKMASSQGYKCEFIDTVLEDFLCKKCNLVARRLTLTSCCGESFCQTCIADTQDQRQACPECKKNEFTFFEHPRSQRRVCSLKIYCSMKERGCVWSGPLDQLDTHLDPHLDNCQYVDTKCPLNCLQTIPKNKVDQHVAQECTKRPQVCQHCGFKATYEEVVVTHLLECKYVALQCPNMCGVSCEREVMEDHMKICRLEEVECEFSSVGCDGRFIREDQDEHARQNSQKHLTLTASLAVETKEKFQQKLLEHENIHLKTKEELERKIEAQSKKLREQEWKIQEQERKIQEQEEKLEQQKKTVKELRQTHEEVLRSCDSKLKKLEQSQQDMAALIFLNRKFEMQKFSVEKAKDCLGDWKSPPIYTHAGGYKFCIGINANGTGKRRGLGIDGNLYAMPGNFDEQLKWPAHVQFEIEIINQHGHNASHSGIWTWKKPVVPYFRMGTLWQSGTFILHSSLEHFLVNDTLYFQISKVIVK